LCHPPGLKVVYTSGYVNGGDLPGDAVFVPKPWRVEEVVEAVSNSSPQHL
jgi:hypothetical protein